MRRLDEGKNGRIILAELMRMASSLGVDTVCEGVETEEMVRGLTEMGVDYLQGYYFSKPLSIEEIFETVVTAFEALTKAPFLKGSVPTTPVAGLFT